MMSRVYRRNRAQLNSYTDWDKSSSFFSDSFWHMAISMDFIGHKLLCKLG